MFDFKFLLLALCALITVCHATEPVVQTPLGRIKGSLMNTRLNKTIYAFRGVRYGKSTEGERRFKIAEPVDPWSDIFDATKEGPSCPLPEVPELASEDCLRLNVYANKLPDSKKNLKRPVIIFFHPGAYYGFSAQSYVFGPQYFLDQDIVLVTINYRLATFGFLSTGDARAPGNLGFKDQVEGLRWIKKNIASFGGDPNSVTITGYSAGGASVILHMISPMSVGLFHKVIASSGSPTYPELLPTKQPELIIKQAKFVNCSTESLDAALDCLKKVPHREISATLPQFAEWRANPVVVWYPVVEPDIPGVERFITDQPVNLLRKGQFKHVPVITGQTHDEFISLVIGMIEQSLKGNNSILQQYDDQWETAAPIAFGYERGTKRSKYISQELKKFYFNNEPINAKNGHKLGEIYSDSFIGFPQNRFINLLPKNYNAPLYYYQFVYRGNYSFGVWQDTKKPYGVAHHDDLQYLYYMSFKFPYLKPDDAANSMVDKLTAMWTNFANTGSPIPKNNDLFKNVCWDTFTPENKKYMEIGEQFTMKSNMYSDRFALWNRLFPLAPVSSQKH